MNGYEAQVKGIDIILEGMRKAYNLPPYIETVDSQEEADAFQEWYVATHPVVDPDVRRAILNSEPY